MFGQRFIPQMLLLVLFPALCYATLPLQTVDFEEASEVRHLLPSTWSIMGNDCQESVLLDPQTDGSQEYFRIVVKYDHDPGEVCGISQRVDAEEYKGKRLNVSVSVNSFGALQGDAGLWVRIDSLDGESLAFKRSLFSSDLDAGRREELNVQVPIYAAANSIALGFYMQSVGDLALREFRMTSNPSKTPVSQIVLDYLSELHGILKQNSVNRNLIDWDGFWKDALLDAKEIQTVENLHQVLPQILWRLGDRHSYFVPAAGPMDNDQAANGPPAAGIDGRLLNNNVGYLWMPGASGQEAHAQEYADSLYEMVVNLSEAGADAWILDLRGNTGGNMWPMIAGIGPIIGDGVLGDFVDPDGSTMQFSLTGNSSRLNEQVRSSVQNPQDGMEALKSHPVAVLAGSTTASSGEAVIVALRCRNRVRQFGAPTRGLSTVNHGFELSDGSLVVLAVSTLADSCGNEYGGTLEPDQIATPSEMSEPSFEDPSVEAAIDWLTEKRQLDDAPNS